MTPAPPKAKGKGYSSFLVAAISATLVDPKVKRDHTVAPEKVCIFC